MMVPLYFIEGKFNPYISLMVLQFVGALIFYPLDKWLFKSKPQGT
jgi:hypothetical protein